MATYRVTVRTKGVEYYFVEAESEQQALEDWHEGEMDYGEVYDADPWSAEEVED